ncbi:MDR family MFS transporter [Paenibacillus macerans]|uniref:Drug resistance MFS transporter, drug:H+ antiporter-2 family protein n=1 Tax=Paenibacillus macerans TaxID=44252 RepID=A0A090ZMG0_PAEMA|nr:MDR family MFS transporter [Paenibacillus macerans]KFN11445.1 drug resistance MFS transporter, drug:H+ antiporter-2 family protein [Paenibacillus macerans]MCY7562032.1 DHA2 family efflux MFS transporter permease subunit [Paenibacillus macerans]MEC0153897.1 MDR family MFS transporter [Paenibacillus macerans]MED4953862.1 MDR family MFS transporter [Paenibacillus macerans]SUA83319.1 Lincomycin resistance protein lmrB [Paenibacillus macerans]
MQASATTGKEFEETKKNVKIFPIVVAFLLSGFIGLFGETALNVALTDLMQVFNIGSATIQWLTTGYLLTLGILVPLSGLLNQRFTTRQLFITALIFSIIGALIGALAPSFAVLMVSRVVQAIGTALLLPLMFNTILIIFPIEKRGAAMGMVTLVILFAPAVGPSISGLLVETLSWHYIFWISLLFLVIALIIGIFKMQNVSKTSKPRIDLLSMLLSTVGFGGIVFGFSSAGEGGGGWTSSTVIVSLAIGVIALTLFSIRQLRMTSPLLDLRAFKYPMFTIGALMVGLCMMVILSSMLVLPMYLQTALAYSTLSAGLILLPASTINGILAPIMGKLFDKYGPKWIVLPGVIFVSAALWMFSTVTLTSTVTFIIAVHIVMMIGVSMIMMPSQTNGLNQLPPNLYPHGTAIMNTLQQVFGAIGTAVAVSVMSNGSEKFMKSAENPSDPTIVPAALTAGVHDAFIFCMIIALIGLVLSIFIKRVTIAKR